MSNINWKPIVEEIISQQGEIRTMGVEFYRNADGRFNSIIDAWDKAGYTPNKVEWINFYPGKHFSETIVNQFAEQVNAFHLRSWISCIRPGKSAPWHQDIDDDLEQYQSKGKLVRYTCHISHPSEGQILLIDKESFYMIPEGTITKWDDYMAWHGASNCGFKNQYLFHFLGYENI
jgi:hypothetical protein